MPNTPEMAEVVNTAASMAKPIQMLMIPPPTLEVL
jgi:hypothetical protein